MKQTIASSSRLHILQQHCMKPCASGIAKWWKWNEILPSSCDTPSLR